MEIRRFEAHSLAARRRQHKARDAFGDGTIRAWARIAADPAHGMRQQVCGGEGLTMRIGVPRKPRPSKAAWPQCLPRPATSSATGMKSGSNGDAGLKSGFVDADYAALGVRIARMRPRSEPWRTDREGQADRRRPRAPSRRPSVVLLPAPCAVAGTDAEVARHRPDRDRVRDRRTRQRRVALATPMSVIAGKIAVQVGTHYLHQPLGGKGKLLGGLPSTERGKVVVFGAGRPVAPRPRWPLPEAPTWWCSRSAGSPRRDDAAWPQRHRAVSLRRWSSREVWGRPGHRRACSSPARWRRTWSRGG